MNENQLIHKECTTNDIELLNDKVLKIESDIDINNAMSKILTFINAQDILGNVQKKSEYIVQIPVEFQKQVDSGEFWIMKNEKTGKEWPNLVKKAENGKQEIVTPLSIKKEEFIDRDPIKEIIDNYRYTALQNQIKNLANLMESTFETVKHIEEGQKGDRIALMESGKQQILLALNQKDKESRTPAIQFGLNNIIVAQQQFLQEIINRSKRFTPISRKNFVRFIKELQNTNYLDEKDDEYNELLEYCKLYVESTNLIASTYVLLGESENADKVYSIAMHQLNQIDFTKVKTIEYIHKDLSFTKVYEIANADLIEDKKIYLNNVSDYDQIYISISGEKILEILNNEED